MNERTKIQLQTALILSIIPFGLFALYRMADWDPCSSEITQELDSPAKGYVARVISRDCGALATGQTYVEVERNIVFASPKEVLEVGPDEDDYLTLRWSSPKTLQIYYDRYLEAVDNIVYKVGNLSIETYVKELVFVENTVRSMNLSGSYLKLVDSNGPTPSYPDTYKCSRNYFYDIAQIELPAAYPSSIKDVEGGGSRYEYINGDITEIIQSVKHSAEWITTKYYSKNGSFFYILNTKKDHEKPIDNVAKPEIKKTTTQSYYFADDGTLCAWTQNSHFQPIDSQAQDRANLLVSAIKSS